MRPRYQTILFDLDGTLLDTLSDLTDGVNHTLAANGFPAHSEAEVRSFVGNGVRTLIARALPLGTDEKTAARITAEFVSYYESHMRVRTAPYAGMLPLLDTLRAAGCRVGVVSNKMDTAVRSLCAHYFGDRVDIAIGESATVRRKPAPDGVFAAMQALGADSASTVYVGDGETDVETALAAGVPCISVLWGFRDRDALAAAGATEFAEDARALCTLLFEEEER